MEITRGGVPNFWRNLVFARHNTLPLWPLREKTGSAKGLAAPPFREVVGGTLVGRSHAKFTICLDESSCSFIMMYLVFWACSQERTRGSPTDCAPSLVIHAGVKASRP